MADRNTVPAAPVGGWPKTPAPVKDQPINSVHNKININTCTAAHLMKAVHQIGEGRAGSVIEHRELHGPFHRMNEIRNITGLTGSLASAIMERCYAGDPDEPSPREKAIDGEMLEA